MCVRPKNESRVGCVRVGLVVINLMLPFFCWGQNPPAQVLRAVHFEPAVRYPAGSLPVSMAAADINGDGFLDVVTGAQDGAFHVLMGNGDGSFQAEIRCETPSFHWCFLAAGDLNGDGKADILLTSNYWRDSAIGIYLSKGDGTFLYSAVQACARPPSGIPRIGTPGPDLGDFNRDGKSDIIARDFINGGIVILQGNGDGAFQPPVRFGSHPPIQALATGDFNGDGDKDLLAVGADCKRCDDRDSRGHSQPGQDPTPFRFKS